MFRDRLMGPRLQGMYGHFPVVVVSGARQVGKTTLLRHVFPEIPYTVFDPAQDVENARADPDLFLANRPPPQIFDEIQYAPEVVAAIKRHVDAQRAPGQYLLTGSQQWGVLRNLAESLAGRAAFIDLEGFCLAELAPSETTQPSWLQVWLDAETAPAVNSWRRREAPVGLYEQLWRGFLPAAQTLPEAYVPDFHESYRRTYIERDVRLVADVADLQLFGKFVQLTAALSAQEINASQVGRDIGVTPQTAQRWLTALQATFQWFEAPAFSGNVIKRLSGKPKGYAADTGAICAAQRISSPKALAAHPLLGALFETAVAAEIRKLAATLPSRPAMYHWRSHGGAEVDIVLERDGRLFPIEIKASSNPTGAAARGSRAFRATYSALNVAPTLVIAPCARSYALAADTCVLPWDAVLNSTDKISL